MPPSSQLTIATNAVTRLLKEEEYHRKDYVAQKAQLEELKQRNNHGEDASNEAYLLKQRETALLETEAVVKQMPDNVKNARVTLENALANASDSDSEEVNKAKEAIAKANEILQK